MTVHFIWNIIITVAKLPLVLSFHCHFYWIFFLKNGILKCLSCSFSFMTLTFYRIIIIVGNPRIGSPLCDMIGVSFLYRFNINKMHIYNVLSPPLLSVSSLSLFCISLSSYLYIFMLFKWYFIRKHAPIVPVPRTHLCESLPFTFRIELFNIRASILFFFSLVVYGWINNYSFVHVCSF